MFVHKFQTTLEVLKAPCSYLSRKNDLSFAYRKCFSAFPLSCGGRHAPSQQHEWAQTSKIKHFLKIFSNNLVHKLFDETFFNYLLINAIVVS